MEVVEGFLFFFFWLLFGVKKDGGWVDRIKGKERIHD